MEELSTRSERLLAQTLVTSARRSQGELVAALRTVADVILGSGAIPAGLRGGLLLTALRLLRAEQRRLEECRVRTVLHAQCTPPHDHALQAEHELWGLPQDDWLCDHCAKPLYDILPSETLSRR